MKKGLISLNLKKRGVSPVVATVLILLITVVAASIISVFVIPFVREGLSGGQECFEILGDLSFDSSPYNCNYINSSDSNIQRTGFSIRMDSDKIIGFKVSLLKSGSADSYEITNGTTDPDVISVIAMLGQNFGNTLVIPDGGGVRTYIANDLFDRVELFPIVGTGRLCEQSDTIEIETCNDLDIGEQITEF